MKAAVVSPPLRNWLLKKPAWFDHQTAVALTFAVKTFAASLLAPASPYIASLPEPVLIVSMPSPPYIVLFAVLSTVEMKSSPFSPYTVASSVEVESAWLMLSGLFVP